MCLNLFFFFTGKFKTLRPRLIGTIFHAIYTASFDLCVTVTKVQAQKKKINQYNGLESFKLLNVFLNVLQWFCQFLWNLQEKTKQKFEKKIVRKAIKFKLIEKKKNRNSPEYDRKDWSHTLITGYSQRCFKCLFIRNIQRYSIVKQNTRIDVRW